MFTAYVIVTLIAIAANAFIAIGDIMRFKLVLSNAASVGVPESWLTWLGILKAAGAGGLLLGLVGANPERHSPTVSQDVPLRC
jgi:hypothetical protein